MYQTFDKIGNHTKAICATNLIMAKMQDLKINILIVFRNVARFFKKSFWGHPVHPTKIKSGQFENGSLLFDCQYLQHFFIKSNNQARTVSESSGEADSETVLGC